MQILSEKWSCWQYCGLTSDIYFCRRALQSPIASASRDDSIGVWRRLLQSVFKVEWSAFSVKLPFSAESGQEIEQSLKGFFRIWIKTTKFFTLSIFLQLIVSFFYFYSLLLLIFSYLLLNFLIFYRKNLCRSNCCLLWL